MGLTTAKAVWMSRDRPATWVCDGLWGPCWSWGHTVLSVLYCFMSPHAMVTFNASAEGHVWVCSPTVASVCVGVWVSSYPSKPCGLLRSGVMLVSEGHALPSGAMVTSKSGCCSELCLGLRGCVLCWSLRYLLAPKVTQKPGVGLCLFFGVREPCSRQSHPDLSAGPTSWSQNFCLGQVAAKGYIRVCGCSWGLSWCLGPVSLQGTMCDEIRAPC